MEGDIVHLCWCQKARVIRVIILSCGIKISAVCFRFVTKHACDGETGRQTNRFTIPKTALLQCMGCNGMIRSVVYCRKLVESLGYFGSNTGGDRVTNDSITLGLELEPTTNGPPTTKIVIRFKVPAQESTTQDPPVPAINKCWLWCRVTTIVGRCCDCDCSVQRV